MSVQTSLELGVVAARRNAIRHVDPQLERDDAAQYSQLPGKPSDSSHRIPMSSHQIQLEDTLGSAILPEGDSYDVPPGLGQYGLLSLLGLLTVAALVAAACKLMSIEPSSTFVLECGVVIFWWKIAQRRQSTEATSNVDQSKLRAEVEQWLRERGRNE